MDVVPLDANLRLNNARVLEPMPSLEARVEALETDRLNTRVVLARLEAERPDLERLVFSPRVVIWLVAGTVSVFGGIWASTYGLRSDVRDIATHLAYTEKIGDERAKANSDSIEQTKRQLQLLQLQMQDLDKSLLQQQIRRK